MYVTNTAPKLSDAMVANTNRVIVVFPAAGSFWIGIGTIRLVVREILSIDKWLQRVAAQTAAT